MQAGEHRRRRRRGRRPPARGTRARRGLEGPVPELAVRRGDRRGRDFPGCRPAIRPTLQQPCAGLLARVLPGFTRSRRAAGSESGRMHRGGELRARRRLRFVAPRQVRSATVEFRRPARPAARAYLVPASAPAPKCSPTAASLTPTCSRRAHRRRSAGNFGYPFSYGYSCVGTSSARRRGAGRVAWSSRFHPHQDRFVVAGTDVVAPAGHRSRARRPCSRWWRPALQLTLDAGPVARETVVVLGLGAVGMLTALLLRRAGARVWPPSRRPSAGRWRRRWASPPRPRRSCRPPPGRRRAAAGGVSGSPAALAGALGLLAHEGTALVGSWYGKKPVPLPLGAAFHRRRLTIRSSQVSTIPAALRGRWDVAPSPSRRRRAPRRAAAGGAGHHRVPVRRGGRRPTSRLTGGAPA